MNIENLGRDSLKKVMSRNDKRAPEIYENTTQLIDGHY